MSPKKEFIVTVKLGIIASAGGAAFGQIAAITRNASIEFTMITDRQCGAEQIATDAGIDVIRIEERNRAAFSQQAAATSLDLGLQGVLLMFDRLVSSDLYNTIPTANIHPAALPAFKGLRGVQDAYSAGVRVMGCTLHEVDETIDEGRIIMQIAARADPLWPLARWEKRAYLMKIYCGLVWVSLNCGDDNMPTPINASHGLRKEWLEKFNLLQEAEGQQVISS